MSDILCIDNTEVTLSSDDCVACMPSSSQRFDGSWLALQTTDMSDGTTRPVTSSISEEIGTEDRQFKSDDAALTVPVDAVSNATQPLSKKVMSKLWNCRSVA